MKKECACWVPKMLTAVGQTASNHNFAGVFDICAIILEIFFLISSLLIKLGLDRTIWSKNESMHWKKKGEKPPRKLKVKISASELMATVFLGL